MLLQNYFDKILYVRKMTQHSWKKEFQVLRQTYDLEISNSEALLLSNRRLGVS